MRQKVKVKSTSTKITLTNPEFAALDKIKKAGSFRSNSETIGESLLFINGLRERIDSVDLKNTILILGNRFGITEISGIIDSKTVWIVYRKFENEGESIFAICESEKIAEKARTKLAATLGESETHFEISEIARDAVHPYGILCQDNSVDVS